MLLYFFLMMRALFSSLVAIGRILMFLFNARRMGLVIVCPGKVSKMLCSTWQSDTLNVDDRDCVYI